MKPRPNLATSDIKRNIDCAEFMCIRFTMASYECLNLWSTKHKLKHSLDLDCFETKLNVENAFN